MVIDDARGARKGSFESAKFGRPIDAVYVVGRVETPPHQFEHVGKRRGRSARCWHAAGKSRVQMVMGIDQTWGSARHRVRSVSHRHLRRGASATSCATHRPDRGVLPQRRQLLAPNRFRRHL